MLDNLTSSAEDPEALKARGIDVGPLDDVVGGDGARSGIEGGMGSGWGSVEAARRGFGGGEQLGKRDASRQPREGSHAGSGREQRVEGFGKGAIGGRKPRVHLGRRSVWGRKLCVVGGISAAGEGSRARG
jgi:hypothetical protein